MSKEDFIQFQENFSPWQVDFLQEVWGEINSHVKNFVGREEILEELKNWITTKPNGYFLLMGNIGVGKSALLAKFSQVQGNICFIHMPRSYKNPTRILQFLIWQAAQMDEYNLSKNIYESDLCSLRNYLLSFLTLLLKEKEKIVIIIDNLDSLELDDLIKIFPNNLPKNVYFFLATKEIPKLINTLENRLNPLTIKKLPPFTLKETKLLFNNLLIKNDLEHLSKNIDFQVMLKLTLSLILKESASNLTELKLISEYIINELKKNVAESLDLDFVISKNNIKLTLITTYNKLLLINKKTTKINQVNLKQLIGLMALSYDALSIGQLFDIFQVNNIDVKKEQIEDYLTQIEDYLIKLPNNKQVFFHHHFANFIKNKLLETQEIVLIYELIINWLETLKNTFLHYYLEHIDNYLIDSILVCLKINDELKTKEVFINLINLLTNIKFLNEKINLGMFNELLSTYKKIISLIPSSLEQEFKEKLLNWFKFLDSESFVIKENIDLDIFLQQAINQNIDKEISIQAINYLEAFNPTQIYFNWLNKPKNHIYKSLKENLINGSVGIQAIKLTSDNKYLVIAGADGQIRIWDFLSKEEIAVLPNGNGLVFSLSLDKDNKYIVLGDSNSLINIWDLNKKELLLSLNKHTGSVLSLLFTTDNKYLISTSVDHTIKIWEFNIEKLIENQSPLIALKEENFIITSVIVTSENQEIIAGSNEGEIIFWDLKTQEKIASLNAHNFAVTSLALTSNNKYLISASEDRQIKIWDLSTKNLVATLTGATSSISKVKITSDDEYIIAGSNDKTIHIWNLTTGLPITVLTGHSDLITDIELTLDNKYVISSSKDGGIKLWNLDYAKSSIIETRQRFNISALAISSDGDLGISAEITGLIKIWDINNQQEIGTINAHKSIINALALTSNNKYLISAGDDFQIKVWDLHSLECIALLNDHQDRISSLLVTLDDKYLISGSDDKTIKIWNLDKKELDTTLPDRAGIYALILKEDNKHFASANFRGKLRLWDLTTKRVIKEQKGWFDTKIAITKNNKYQVSRADNNFLTLFDLTNELVIATFPTISLVTRNVISDNGVILSCDQLGNLYFLKVENLEI